MWPTSKKTYGQIFGWCLLWWWSGDDDIKFGSCCAAAADNWCKSCDDNGNDYVSVDDNDDEDDDAIDPYYDADYTRLMMTMFMIIVMNTQMITRIKTTKMMI